MVQPKGRSMYTTFHNVTISVRAKDTKHAYTKLCNALAGAHADWHTDTYTTEEDEKQESTSQLFPE